MNLIGKNLKHKVFGTGPVVAQEGIYLTIEFPSKLLKFVYNEINFSKFLKAEDPEIHAAILKEFEDQKEALKQKELQKAMKKQQEEEARQKVLAAQQFSTKKPAAKKSVLKQERIPGKRMTFYVFQGNTFDRESKGGYLWAPICSKDGGTPHHWTRMLDVQKGDIILHGCNAQVQAVSIVRDKCYDCIQPSELRTEELWEQAGRRIDCEYLVLDRPIRTADYVDDILRLCNVKYAPFDKDGNGNMGYLYEINRELARIFLRGIVKANPQLANVEYISELLAEK